jgi:hypothetical protein
MVIEGKLCIGNHTQWQEEAWSPWCCGNLHANATGPDTHCVAMVDTLLGASVVPERNTIGGIATIWLHAGPYCEQEYQVILSGSSIFGFAKWV